MFARPTPPQAQATDFAVIACSIATGRPLYARAYLAAMEAAGRIPKGLYRVHDGEINRVSESHDAEESRRGRLHAEAGKRPTFVDTDIRC